MQPTAPPIAAPQSFLALTDALVGQDYAADLPPFTAADGAKTLVMHIERDPPDGLAFSDLGGGLARISGKPTKPGRWSFDIVAEDQARDSARMTTTIVVATPPAPSISPPQKYLSLDDAMVGRNYTADLPPFEGSDGVNGLGLHIESNLPEGLAFTDLGHGFGRISGKPTTAGRWSFEIVAKGAAGGSASMTATIVVAPSATPPPPSPENKIVNFLHDFEGGPCFLARSVAGSADAPTILGVGADQTAFDRFYKTFIHDLGVEPTFLGRPIATTQCPVIDLIRAVAADGVDAPKIELAGYEASRNKSVAGAVSNIAGRLLNVLLVSADGQVRKLESHVKVDGASATFNVPFVAEAASSNALQVVIAIVSTRPLQALANFKMSPAVQILPRLQSELPDDGAVVAAEFVKFVN